MTLSSPAWMSSKQTISAKDDFPRVRFFQQNIGKISASSPQINPAVGEIKQNENDIEVFLPLAMFTKMISRAFLKTAFPLRPQTTSAKPS